MFVNSMSDLFHEHIPDAFIAQVFKTMELAPRHTFQVLTKRPVRALQLAEMLPWPGNVWMGVSVEDERVADRLDLLRGIPAAVRFISAEPLLGSLRGLSFEGIDWVIAGGESGTRARAVDPEWIREIRDTCQATGVAFFFKQWGGRHAKARGRVLDGREWSEYPAPAVPGIAA